MPVLAVEEDSEGEKSNSSFIHLQNIPWSATRSDVREFFKDVTVKEGGVLIRGFEAFVALEDPLDMVVALFQEERLLHDSIVRISVITKDEMQERIKKIVRRKLDFGQIMENDVKTRDVQTRKIRPTPVCKGQKRRAIPSLTFLPEELAHPAQCSMDSGRISSANQATCGTKKLHPTRISDLEAENFAVFHPQFCYDPMKAKLDVHTHCV